jgi:hypothetical protein
VRSNNNGSSWEINTRRNRSGGDHQSQHTPRHQLLEEKSPNEELSCVMRADSGLNKRLILRIARDKIRIETILGDNSSNLCLNLLLTLQGQRSVRISREGLDI